MLFIYSKVPELVDTAFVVLRKKPLIFLHWYHHVTVLLYCWHSYYTLSSAGLYFVGAGRRELRSRRQMAPWWLFAGRARRPTHPTPLTYRHPPSTAATQR